MIFRRVNSGSSMKREQTKKIVILGGGMAGWAAAAALGRRLKPEFYEVIVVESSHIDSLGVGESVLPSVISFIRNLGLDEGEFIQKVKAGPKLGIQFQDWCGKGSSYFHPFGTIGGRLDGFEFFQYWLKARAEGDPTPLMDYSPAAVMAKHGKFVFPFKFSSGSPLAGADYAMHLDAGLAVRYLREFSEKHHVKRITGHVVRVHKRENGNIESIELNSREVVQGDFFIDCSGIRAMLIGEALNVGYESWKHFLPCDRAVTVQSAHSGPVTPYSISRAKEDGWSWRIPLQNRISSGYVFSSEHCSDNQARKELLDSMEGDTLYEPRFIPLRTGIRKQMWKKNCIALGLAGGFLEPLESTAIHLITRGVQFLLELFPNLSPDEQDWPGLATEYTARMLGDYEEIRDFIVLHYCTTERTDTDFWLFRRSLPIPDSLGERIELFRATGQLRVSDDCLFKKPDWQAIFTGMGVIPHHHHPFADMGDFDRIHQMMRARRDQLEAAVQDLPVYHGFTQE